MEAHRALDRGEQRRGAGFAVQTLRPREETPGEPQLVAQWKEESAQPGDKVHFTLGLRDASGKPVVGAGARYWIGPKGTVPPSPSEDPKGWERASTLAKTNAAGEIEGAVDAPKLVRKGGSTTLRIVAHADLFGRGLKAERSIEVSVPSPQVTAIPESGDLVPGIEQALVVSVRDGRDRPVAGTFTIEGDGLSQKVTTNAWGEAEVTWRVPRDIGAARNVGPCAGGVAATVSVRPAAALPALDDRTDPFTTCVRVTRELAGIVRADKSMITAGGSMRMRVDGAPEEAGSKGGKGAAGDKGAAAHVWSVVATPAWLGGPGAMGGWLEDAARGADFPLATAAPGVWDLTGLAPSTSRAARAAAGRVIVRPRVAPKLAAKMTGGRAAPLGTVEIDVDLTDGKGTGIPGSVAGILIDAFGGGTIAGLDDIDTRTELCGRLRVADSECDAFFDDPAAETLRRRVLGQQGIRERKPARDPGGTAKEELRSAFKNVLLSLEGAVMDATSTPDTLRDAFRKEKSAFTFNPELFTLVTAAIEPPPETPGGEPITLGDLVALDKQVTYDNVARRVTRLKLFRVLSAVRRYRQDRNLDPDEPVLRDPNAILRRLTRTYELDPQALIDPWGGTMAFVKATGPRAPFVNVKGFELRSPGPDGKLGTGDDVKSPFERVVRSGTPYADAMDEDRLVDAELDMEVSEATVDAWESVLQEVTGQLLGMHGAGEGGGGRGEGFGLGGIGTIGHGSGSGDRRSHGISPGAAFWLPPQRTDDKGHVRVRVPLGDVETTWRLALVGAPDGATPAVTSLDIPSALPLSARVEAGASWIEGDEADVVVTVRNRTASAAPVTLTITAKGAAKLVTASAASRTVDVPPGGAVPVIVRVRAPATGTATLDVVAAAPGIPEDRTSHTWQVRPAGELVDLTSTQWVEGRAVLALSQVGPGLRAIGTARLTLERDSAQAIEAALDALDPDAIGSLDGLSYAQEAAARIQKWATARGGDADPLAQRAGSIVRRSIGRLLAYKESTKSDSWTAQRRALRWAPADLVSVLAKIDDCPKDTDVGLGEGLPALEAEPTASDGVIQACWDALATQVSAKAVESSDPVALARAVLAFAERPHRAAMTVSLAQKLRAWVELRPSGGVTLPAAAMKDRTSRALVFAALLRTASLGKAPAATPDRIAAWLRVQRDVTGSYGSTLATLAAVRALLSGPAGAQAPTKVTVIAGGVRKEVEVKPNATVDVPLGASVTQVELTSEGPGLIARLFRPGVRAWSSPPDTSSAPIAFDVTWPEKPKAGTKDVLHVSASTKTGRSLMADLRVPLPPGVALAEGLAFVRQIQGQLVVRVPLDPSGTDVSLDLPIRFALAGRFTVPEARGRPAFEEGARVLAPARPLRVSP